MDKVLQTITISTFLHYISVRDVGKFIHCGPNFRGVGTKSVFLYYEHRVFASVYGNLTYIYNASSHHYFMSFGGIVLSLELIPILKTALQ